MARPVSRAALAVDAAICFALAACGGMHATRSSGGDLLSRPQTPQEGTLPATLELRVIQGEAVAFQNGIPLPTFDPQERSVVSLSGGWRALRFAADHDGSMAARTEEWLRAAETEGGGITDPAYDDSRLPVRSLPAPENRMMAEERGGAVERYEDGVWYRRRLHLDAAPAGRVFILKCLGASYVLDLWVNGSYVGAHEGGYTPFAFDLTSYLKAGEDNTIVLRLDNPPWGSRIDTIPAREGTDFFNYTGMIQDFYLEALPPVYLSRVDVVPLAPEGRARLRAVVHNPGDQARELTLSGAIYDTDPGSPGWLDSPLASRIERTVVCSLPERRLRLGPGETAVIREEVVVGGARAWSILEPNLYVADLSVRSGSDPGETDRLATQFGFRTVRTDGTIVRLNGKPVFLAGIARHEDWLGTGRTADWARIVHDLTIIAELGATFVRTAHYPNHVATYIALDRLGLAAMSEIPVWQFEPESFRAQEKRGLALQMWREMIYSQYNRPSVLLWSTQNESNAPQLRIAYNRALVDDLRKSYDDGRLVTQSAAADRPGAHDPSMEPLDVAGWTMYFGIFHGSTPREGTRAFLDAAHRRWPTKPILNTEYGYWSGETDDGAAAQVGIVRSTLGALAERSAVTPDGRLRPDGFLLGVTYWTAFNWYANHGKWVQTMGLLHLDRLRRKPAAEEVSRSYREMLGSGRGMGPRP